MPQRLTSLFFASWRLGVSSLCLLAALCATAAAQAPTEFDVASIKRHRADEPGSSIRTMPDGTFVAVNIAMRNMLGTAYPSQNGQYAGVPEWAETERYDVTAKPPAGATPEQVKQMWRALFTERMKLVAHDEMREEAIYNLVFAREDGRLGPQLKASARDCDAERAAARQQSGPPRRPVTEADFLEMCGYRVGGGRLISGGMTLEDLARQIGGSAGRIVRDRTGLKGWYTVDFRYATASPGTGSAVSDPGEPPSVFTAVQEQLGLKLESDRMQVQTVVIDHMERPTEN
jgi:uncharacterized protein (TIGR03435 family)